MNVNEKTIKVLGEKMSDVRSPMSQSRLGTDVERLGLGTEGLESRLGLVRKGIQAISAKCKQTVKIMLIVTRFCRSNEVNVEGLSSKL